MTCTHNHTPCTLCWINHGTKFNHVLLPAVKSEWPYYMDVQKRGGRVYVYWRLRKWAKTAMGKKSV